MSRVEFPNQPVNIQVVVRCRPPTVKEKLTQVMAVAVKPKHEVSVNLKCGQNVINKLFKFDQVYDQDATQEQLYRGTIKPIVGEVLTGYNCTVFAYGQTGTGKTHTMEGVFENPTVEDGPVKLGKLAGVIPRAIQHIFNTLERSGCVYSVKLSILELYNEELHDMLTPDGDVSKDIGKRGKSKLRLFDDTTRKGMGIGQGGSGLSTAGGVTISGLEEVPVRRLQEVLELMKKAMERRQMAETKLNAASSRSHMITTVTLHMKETTDTGEDLWKVGKLNLVDLAGSENILRSGAHGKNQKEAGMINQSLLTLGRVINALVEGQPHIPYRESKLTRLLQDSLGGKTKTCIIATIAPTGACLDETASTLEYAHRAKSIKNRPEVNQRMTKKHVVKEIMETNEELQRLLMAAREKSGIYLPLELYEKHEEERSALRIRVQELEESLDESRCNNRRKDKRLKVFAGVMEQLQKHVTTLEENNRAHISTFEQFHSKSSQQMQGDIQDMQSRTEQMVVEVTSLVDTVQKWASKLAKQGTEELDSNNERLTGLMKIVVEHAEAVQGWNLKMAEECAASGQQLSVNVSDMKRDILQATKGCVDAVTKAKDDFKGFLSRVDGQLRAEVCDSHTASLTTLQGHATNLASLHADGMPQVKSAVGSAVGAQMQNVLHQAQDMHSQNWSTFDNAFRLLSDAVGAFAQAQQDSRNKQQMSLAAMAGQVTKGESFVVDQLNTELGAIHSLVDDKTKQMCADATVAMKELDQTVESISGTLMDYSKHTDEICKDAVKLTTTVDTMADDLFHCCKNREAQSNATMQYNSHGMAQSMHALVAAEEDQIRQLQTRNTNTSKRTRDFADQLPREISKLEATKKFQQHGQVCKTLLPNHKVRIQEFGSECRDQLVQHAELVKKFTHRQQLLLEPSSDLEDDDVDPSPPSSPDSRATILRGPTTPLTDPQGRRHMRTPLQEIINRECFSGKIISPEGKLSPSSTKMVSPNSKITSPNSKIVSPTAKVVSPNSGKVYLSPSKAVSPQRPLFVGDDMQL